jgi:flavorubredoxin
MQAIKVSDAIWWVGVIDWELRDFHGYETPDGTTYNAYLVQGESGVALVDTVKKPFVPELLSRIESVMPLEKITTIVVNHVEPDHNGGLPEVMAAIPGARVVASPSGVRGVADYHNGLVVEPVKDGDVIDLGGKTLTFLPQPMLHWPDSMFTFCPEECVLMPNDAFGQHYASEARFADEVGLDTALYQLGVYYANILMPLGMQVGKALEKIAERGWACKVVAPSHGLIWRGDDIARASAEYQKWSGNTLRDKAVVAFSTMWGSTDALAHSITDGLASAGVEAAMFDIATSRLADITFELLEAKALVLGSSTLHHGMLYRVAGLLQWLAGLKPEGRMAATFGSYGWSKGADKQMRERLTEIGFELPSDDFMVKFRPTDEDLAAAEAWGKAFGETIKAR